MFACMCVWVYLRHEYLSISFWCLRKMPTAVQSHVSNFDMLAFEGCMEADNLNVLASWRSFHFRNFIFHNSEFIFSLLLLQPLLFPIKFVFSFIYTFCKCFSDLFVGDEGVIPSRSLIMPSGLHLDSRLAPTFASATGCFLHLFSVSFTFTFILWVFFCN